MWAWLSVTCAFTAHTTPSQLNGNNGEWTNGDDMGPKGQKGNSFIAQKAFHQRQAGSSRKCKYGPPDLFTHPSEDWESGSGSNTSDNCQEEAPKFKPTTILVGVVAPDVQTCTEGSPCITYDGSSYSESRIPTQVAGVAVLGTKSGPGYYTTSENEDDQIITESPFSKVTVPGYRYSVEGSLFIEHVAKVNFLVLTGLLAKLKNQFCRSIVDDSMLLAIHAYVEKVLPATPRLIMYGKFTAECFIALKLRSSRLALMNATGALLATNGEFISRNNHNDYFAMKSFEEHQNRDGLPFRIPDVECDAPLDWPVRRDVTMKIYDVNGIVDRKLHGGELLWLDTAAKDRYRTAYFSITGSNEEMSFVEYSSSGRNASHALKRIIGARSDEDGHDDEARYRARSSRVAEILLRKHHDDSTLANYCKWSSNSVYVEEFEDNLDLGRYDDLEHAYMVTCPYSHIAADAIGKVIKTCQRNRLDQFVDLAKEQLNGWREWCTGKTERVTPSLTEWLYSKVFSSRDLDCQTRRSLCAAIPHAKQKLRKRYVDGQALNIQSVPMVKELSLNLKRELAKANKCTRLTADYGAGCMEANELPEYVKVCLDGWHSFEHNGFTVMVLLHAKPKCRTATSIFRDLYEGLSRDNFMMVVVYSDDYCITGCHHGTPFAANLDISANDAAQSLHSFVATQLCLAQFDAELASNLIAQCELPFRLVNPSNKDEHVIISVDGPFEGSGTCLTTILNFMNGPAIASVLGYLLSLVPAGELCDDELKKCVATAAESVGHKMTVELCGPVGSPVFEKIQFLKRYPALTITGEWVACICEATILRSLGTVWDDHLCHQLGMSPATFGALTMKERMDLMCTAAISSWVNEPETPLLSALRTRFSCDRPLSADVIASLSHNSLALVASEDSSRFMIDVESRAKRYTADTSYGNLCKLILRLSVGDFISSYSMDEMMRADYGF